MDIKKTSIELYKLYNGYFIIGEVCSDEDSDTIEVDNPRQMLMMPSMSGSMSIALKPICFPFAVKRLKDKFELQKSQIMFTMHDSDGEIDKELIDGYKAEVSGIAIASAAETNAVANGGNLII